MTNTPRKDPGNLTSRQLLLCVLPALALMAVFLPDVATGQTCDPWVAKIVSVEGSIEARRAEQVSWTSAKVGDTFCAGDRVRVPNWRAAIVLSNETIIRLDEGTTLTFTEIKEDKSSWIDILEGLIHFISRVPQRLNITTPFVNAAVEGTEFIILVDPWTHKVTRVWVFEGRVRLANALGSLVLVQDQSAEAQEGQAPRRLDLHPRDAVQWALYYPPLIDIRTERLTGPNRKTLQGAFAMYHEGDLLGALSQLDAVPPERRDVEFYNVRAGFLLSVGRVAKARDDIAQSLTLERLNATALALQSIIALVQNDKDTAMNKAREAVKQAPDSPVAHMALSYAQQAAFDIDKALASAQTATKLAPQNALAWARVAELLLSEAYVDDALEAAERAVAENPRLARTQTVLGFARLTQLSLAHHRTRAEAIQAFEKAIELDQSDPLPRLGLGLAKIGEGVIFLHKGGKGLEEGRREIEIAASLDPTNPIVRSYLGKAYYQERRNALAVSQLERAKFLDPKDPTPYFYDAIRKQSINRPVEAIQDLQKSIELNNYRAVYRSSLLMDEDFAARSASLGRIYKDLGFQQRARVEGWWSLTNDPTSYSAHRLLADSYANSPLFGAARISELLQFQLLEPLNINNLQPQSSTLALQILEGAGPGTLSFNEFNPLFMGNRLAFLGNGVVGNQNTVGDDVILSGILGPMSLSLGQFHFATDGFQPTNGDITQDLYNVFVQGAVHPKVNLQGEFQDRDTKRGDTVQNFDPISFKPTERRSENQKTARAGIRIKALPNLDVLGSFIYSKLKEETNDPTPTGAPFSVNTQLDSDAYQGEAQALFRHRLFNAVMGGGRSQVSNDTTIRTGAFVVILPPIPPGIPFPVPAMTTRTQVQAYSTNLYTYINAPWPKNVTWTGGIGWEETKVVAAKLNRVLPKAGVQWNLTDWARFRLAYFQTVKRTLVVEQTIEPTQVSGFNQIFDDGNGAWAQHFGIALDTHPINTFYGGIRLRYRESKLPAILVRPGMPSVPVTFRREERIVRTYFYWTPHRYWALNLEFVYDLFKKPLRGPTDILPTRVATYTLPLSARFFHPNGMFGGLGGVFLWQNLDLSPNSTFTQNSEDVFLVNGEIGYRFKKRRGIMSLQVRNLFDNGFRFQDKSAFFGTPLNPVFTPERLVLFKITIALN